MSRNLSINTNEKAYVYIRFDNHNMFAISRIASKLNAVNNLVRKNLSNNNNNDNNDELINEILNLLLRLWNSKSNHTTCSNNLFSSNETTYKQRCLQDCIYLFKR